jgi:hypothetical protein
MAADHPSPGFQDTDPIQPLRVEHKVDEIIIDGQIEQSYNLVIYTFDSPAGALNVRAYLDAAHEAVILPPFRAAPGQPPVIGEDWATRDAVIGFLARRFLVIKELGPSGYRVIWMATHARRALEHRGLPLES